MSCRSPKNLDIATSSDGQRAKFRCLVLDLGMPRDFAGGKGAVVDPLNRDPGQLSLSAPKI